MKEESKTKKNIGEDIFGRYGDDVLKYLHVSDTLPFRQEDLELSNLIFIRTKKYIPNKEALMRSVVTSKLKQLLYRERRKSLHF